MLNVFSQRLLTVLQLTRMALVFTAISNSLCALMLWARWNAGDAGRLSDYLTIWHCIAVSVMSLGLYCFGMSLNDINDRRRDSQLAAHRPIPSGRIGVGAAHVVCAIFGITALTAGYFVTRFTGAGWLSVVLLIWTGALITFYDFAGKYLVAIGLVTLGLIRFFHATIAAPHMPLLWHPLLLLNHVTIISALAYKWEAKRPPITRGHWLALLGGLALVDVASIVLIGWRRHARFGISFTDALWIRPALIIPLLAVIAFIALALAIHRAAGDRRRAGQTLMLYGLLWLIVYDAAFATAYANWIAGLLLLLFLPMAVVAVQFMRAWSKVVSLSQPPEFQRIR